MSLDIREIFEIVRKRFWIVIAMTLTGLVISGVLSYLILSPVYEAGTSIIIGKAPNQGNQQMNYSDVMLYQQVIKTYSEIAKSGKVAEATSKELGGKVSSEFIRGSITVTSQNGTQIMYLKAQGDNPEEITKMVNTHAKMFIRETTAIYPTGSISIMDEAKVPQSPIKPRPMMNMAIGFFLGLMLSVGIIFLIEYMDNTIKTENDVEKYLGVPVIGIIPKNIDN